MKRGLKFVVLFVAVNIFLISFVSAYANLAASANGGTASLVSITGIATGSLGNAIDQNSETYYGVTRFGMPCCDSEMNINCIASFTEEINLSAPSKISTIDYDIYFFPSSLPNFPFASEGLIKEADISIYQGGSWTPVVNNAVADGSVSGPWSNVEKVRSTVYTRVWYNCDSCGNGCLDLTRYGPVAQLNELKAWGFYCGDGTCDEGENNANCPADCPIICTYEGDVAFCSRLEKECGSVTANDNCGDSRTVDNCGNCDTLYPGEERTCQSGSCILPDRVFWADTNGNPITEASIGSTVWMIYENRAEQTYNFNIIEDDIINNDDIRTILSSESFDYGLDLGAEWIITQADFDKGSDTGELIDGEEEFKFIVNGITSEQLIVSAGNYNNTPPTTNITNPKYKDVYVINKSTLSTTNIPFTQISSDINDDLKLTWEFGDGTENQIFENIITTGLGNTFHSYAAPGTKSIQLTAEEMSPPRAASEVQSASDATEIYVYGEGVVVFAIITTPNPSEMQELTSRFVEVNASATHIVNCSYEKLKCEASGGAGSCKPYNDTITKEGIWCYKFPQTEQNKTKMEWTFDGDVNNKLIGTYGANYSKVVEFIKVFEEPGKHTLNLRASYTTL